MMKKLTLLAVALGALAALVTPAMAGAAVFTDSKAGLGNALPAGTKITGTGIGLKTTTSLGTIECEQVMLNVEITKTEKAKNLTEGQGLAGSTATGCKFQPGGQEVRVTEINIGKLVSTGTENTITFSSTAEIPVGGKYITCEFETPEPSPVTGTPTTDVMHLEVFLESELCGESVGEGTLTTETPDGTPVIGSEGK